MPPHTYLVDDVQLFTILFHSSHSHTYPLCLLLPVILYFERKKESEREKSNALILPKHKLTQQKLKRVKRIGKKIPTYWPIVLAFCGISQL